MCRAWLGSRPYASGRLNAASCCAAPSGTALQFSACARYFSRAIRADLGTLD
jgi:hypothetical protein